MTVEEAWQKFAIQQRLATHIPRVEHSYLESVFREGFEAGKQAGKQAGLESVIESIDKIRKRLIDGRS